MDEFKKPYEYIEEKSVSGVLLILFFMLIAIEPFTGILAISFGYLTMMNYGIWGTIFLCGAFLFMLSSIFAGIVLKCKLRFAVRFAKFFLLFRLLFLMPYIYLNTQVQLKDIPFEKTYSMYTELQQSIMASHIMSMSYVIVFSAAWFIYLSKSKKVKELFSAAEAVESVKL